MFGVIVLLQLVLAAALLAAFLKLSARALRSTFVSWKHALIWGAIAMVVGTLATVTMRLVVPELGLIGLVAGPLLQVFLGAWYLGTRATSASGAPVGYKFAAVLVAVAVGALLLLASLIMLALPGNLAPS